VTGAGLRPLKENRMEIEIGLISGVSLGFEYQELDKGYLVFDLFIIRILLSRATEE